MSAAPIDERAARAAPIDDGLSGRVLVRYSNVRQFEAIGGSETLLLFYTESADDVLFDPDNDARLLGMFERSPYAFRNAAQLAEYEALVTRAAYTCRAHPEQDAARELAAAQLATPTEADALLVLVYRRDAPSASAVRNRRRSPFTNAANGTAAPRGARVVLFRQYSFAPVLVGRPVWHNETRLNATVGLLGLRVERLFR